MIEGFSSMKSLSMIVRSLGHDSGAACSRPSIVCYANCRR